MTAVVFLFFAGLALLFCVGCLLDRPRKDDK